MHLRLRAPLLSAASSTVRIWIMTAIPRVNRLLRRGRSRALEHFLQRPRLVAGDGAALRDGHDVAFVALVRLVVRLDLGTATQDLAVGRVRHQTLHRHGDGLVHLVADDLAGQHAGLLLLVHFLPALTRSLSTVFTRAMS